MDWHRSQCLLFAADLPPLDLDPVKKSRVWEWLANRATRSAVVK